MDNNQLKEQIEQFVKQNNWNATDEETETAMQEAQRIDELPSEMSNIFFSNA